MKKLFSFFLFAAALSTVAFAQSPSTIEAAPEAEQTGGPVMTFETTTVDYGTIEQHSERVRFLKFSNTGDAPLLIQTAKGSCGCTVPTWPKEAIMPGESSEIKISYDTKRLGNINKRVTITTNEGGEPHVLKVIGKINPAEKDEGVPAAKPTVISAPSKGGR